MKREVTYAHLDHSNQFGTAEIVNRTTNYRTTGIMRKYYQVALVIVAAVSLVSLLFYRHEYNKLRYVLEVLNFFGKPGEKIGNTKCSKDEPVVEKSNLIFDSPLPSWQRLRDDLYVYSAYDIRKGEIRAIGLGKINGNLNLHCRVHFGDGEKSIAGKFSSISIDSIMNEANEAGKTADYRGYHFICEFTGDALSPVGVTFARNISGNLEDAHTLAIGHSPRNLSDNGGAICVAPSLSKFLKRDDMITFLNFHDLIGTDNFLVYDFGIPRIFNEALKSMASKSSPHWKFSYTTLPWNFPFTNIHPNVIKDIVRTDCSYRTYNKVAYSVTLTWEEYVVLTYHRSLPDLLADLDRSNKYPTNRYKIKTMIFCTQQSDDVHAMNSTPTVFRKTHSYRNVIERRPVYIDKSRAMFDINNSVRATDTDLVFINRYQFCHNIDDDLDARKYDSRILRFAEAMSNGAIMERFTSGRMFPASS